MATKADFTEDEWHALQKGVTGAGMLVSVSDAVHGGGFGLTASREKVETETMAALRSAVTTLSAKAPDEVGAYRQLVLDLAEAVAGAKGGVTETETKVIDSVREALEPS
jgi:hypothetical protein